MDLPWAHTPSHRGTKQIPSCQVLSLGVLKLQEPRQLGAKYFHLQRRNRDISCRCPCQTLRFSSATIAWFFVRYLFLVLETRNTLTFVTLYNNSSQEPWAPVQASIHRTDTQQEQPQFVVPLNNNTQVSYNYHVTDQYKARNLTCSSTIKEGLIILM